MGSHDSAPAGGRSRPGVALPSGPIDLHWQLNPIGEARRPRDVMGRGSEQQDAQQQQRLAAMAGGEQ